MKAPYTRLSSTFHPFYITLTTTSSTAGQLQLSAAAGPLIAGIQTQEQLDNLLNSFFFHGIQCVVFCLIGWLGRAQERWEVWWIVYQVTTQADEKRQETIHDPPALNPKGLPRSQRMTAGATEGCPRGGGASIPSLVNQRRQASTQDESVGYAARKVILIQLAH